MNISITKEFCDRSYRGKLAAVICTKGCNMKCPFCFSGHLIGKAEVFEGEFEPIYQFLNEHAEELDGVVITGGEPTLHKELPQWMKRIKELGLSIKLETNGTEPEILRQLIQNELVDFVAMDIKATPENYATVCGGPVDTDAIRNSIWILKTSSVDYEFTTTPVPGYHTIRELRKIAGMINGAKRYVVRDFVSQNALRPDLRGRAAFPHKPIESIRHIIERKVDEFVIESNNDAVVMYIPGRRKRRRRADLNLVSA